MANIIFSNTPVEMRLAASNFGIAPVQAAYDFLASYSPVNVNILSQSSTYLALQAYDYDYQYIDVDLWVTSRSSYSISLSKMALEVEATGFRAELTGNLTFSSSGYVSGSISGLTLKNADSGLVYMTVSAFSEDIAGTFYTDPTESLAASLVANDTIAGGNYSDYLLGYAGSDCLKGNGGNDTLDGGAGNDLMLGGSGNDVYVVNSVYDRVFETTSSTSTTDAGGADLVKSAVSFTLGSFVEKLSLTGTTATNGTGNGAANTLTGNAAANTLNGGSGADTIVGAAGNDLLIGGAGRDSLTGGAGNDTFDFNRLSDTGITTSTWDIITDFVRGQDRIDLSTLDANTSTTANEAFTSVIASTASFTAAGQLKVSGGVLYCNTDGDSAAELAIGLTGIASLGILDFVL